MGGDSHQEEGAERDEPDDHLRLHRQDLLQRPYPTHLWLTFLSSWEPPPWKNPLWVSKCFDESSFCLQPPRSSWDRCLSLHHGLSRRVDFQLWRRKESLEDGQVVHSGAFFDAGRPHALCP